MESINLTDPISEPKKQDRTMFVLLDHHPLPMIASTNSRQHLQTLKSMSKTVQSSDKSTFVEFQLAGQTAKVYSLNEPKTLLYEINLKNFAEIKWSKKDRTFVYFSIRNNSANDEPGDASVECPNSYTCYFYHTIKFEEVVQLVKAIKARTEKPTPPVQQPIPVASGAVEQMVPTLDQQAKVAELAEVTNSDQLLLALDDCANKSSSNDLLDLLANPPEPETKPKSKDLFNLLHINQQQQPKVTSNNPFEMNSVSVSMAPSTSWPQIATSSHPLAPPVSVYLNNNHSIQSGNLNSLLSQLPSSVSVSSLPVNLFNPILPNPVTRQPDSFMTSGSFEVLQPTRSASNLLDLPPPVKLTNPTATASLSQSNNPFASLSKPDQPMEFGSEFNSFLTNTIKSHFKSTGGNKLWFKKNLWSFSFLSVVNFFQT